MNAENDTVLAEVARVLPLVQAALGHEVGIALTDREKILLYKPAQNLDLHTQPNSPLREGTGLYRIIHEQVPHTTIRVDKALHGVPYVAKAGAV